MKLRFVSSMMVLGLSLALGSHPLLAAWAAEASTGAPEAAAQQPAGLVGTIVAVVPDSRTLVVDVPLGEKEILRLGAEVTDKTKITARGQAVALDRLKTGDRVRIIFRRVATGDEAISVEVLGGA